MVNDLHDPPGMERDLPEKSVSKADRWLYCRGSGEGKGYEDQSERGGRSRAYNRPPSTGLEGTAGQREDLHKRPPG